MPGKDLREELGLGYTYQDEPSEEPIMQAPLSAPQPVHPLRAQAALPAPNPDAPERTLFVKIDNHLEVVDEVMKARRDIKAMAGTIELLANAEKLKSEAIEKMEATLNLLDGKLDEIDNQLVTPDMAPPTAPVSGTPILMPAGEELHDLKGQLESLRGELNQL